MSNAVETTDSAAAQPITPSKPAIPFRWYALIVLATVTVAIVLVRADPDKQIQRKNIHTAISVIVAACALVVWMLGLSRWHWKRRSLVVLVMVGLVGTAAATLDIEQVDGDLVPIVVWKWQKKHDRQLDPLNIPPSSHTKDATKDVSGKDDPAFGEPVIAGLIDFPQFLGPSRDAKLAAPRLATNWSANPPRELWRRPIGAGWSGFAVVGHRAITQEQRGDLEMVVCYDIRTGEPIWKHEDIARYDTTIGGAGPRATPTVHNGRVYTHGGTGLFNCLDLQTGEAIWSRNTIEDSRSNIPEWGVAGSPLVVDGMVVINTGAPAYDDTTAKQRFEGKPLATVNGSLIAYDAATGKKRWAAGRDDASYSSPMLTTLAGRQQIVILNHTSVSGHATDTGTMLWSHPWPGGQPKVAQPVVLPNDRLFITSGYGVGCEMIRVTHDDATDKFATDRLFKNIKLRAKFTNVIHHEGHIYGLNDGLLVCLDAETGEWAWRGKRYGHGQLLFVDGVLLIQAERGHIALVDAKPDAFNELATFDVFKSKTWNNPTLAGKYLLVRNDREAVCLSLPHVESDSKPISE